MLETIKRAEDGDGWIARIYETDNARTKTALYWNRPVASVEECNGLEEKQAALDALKTIEEEWLNGEASEESFAALAAEKSDDPGSVATGGLYEDIYKGQMVQGFNDFCFAGHEKGDTGIVYGESGAYSGYHLIYFVGETGKLRGWQMAEDALRSRDYNDFFDAVVEPYTAEQTPEWDYVMSR